MNKKVMVIRITFILLLLYFGSNNNIVVAYSNPKQDKIADFWNNIYNVEEKRLVAEIPESNIKLYYVREDEELGMYFRFILQINDRKKYFRWENVNKNPTYYPELSLADLDNDGKEELVIELCHGYGTGIFDGEVHVIRQDSFEEILVENPSIILHKEKITLKEFPEHFEVVLNNKKVTLNKKGRLTPPYSNVGIGWGDDNTRYEVKNNKLHARVPLAVSVILTGEFIVKYKYQDKILQMESVEFLDFEKLYRVR